MLAYVILLSLIRSYLGKFALLVLVKVESRPDVAEYGIQLCQLSLPQLALLRC